MDSVQEATNQLAAATDAVLAARTNVQHLIRKVRVLRSAVTQAKLQVQTGMVKLTPEQAVRDYIAQSQEQRRFDAVHGVIDRRVAGPSALDRGMTFSTGHHIDAGLGAGAHRRGALTRAAAMTVTNLAKRAAKGI